MTSYDTLEFVGGLGKGKKKARYSTPQAKIAQAQKLMRPGERKIGQNASSGNTGARYGRIAANSLVRSALNMPGARVIKALPKAEQNAVKAEQKRVIDAILKPQTQGGQLAPVNLTVNNPAPVAAAVDAIATGTESNPVDLTFDTQADVSAVPGDMTATEAIATEAAPEGVYVGYDEEGNYWWEDGSVTAADGTWYPADQLGGLGFLKKLLKKIPIVKNNINTITGAISAWNPAAGAVFSAATQGGNKAPAPAPAPARPAPIPLAPGTRLPPVRPAALTNNNAAGANKLPSWAMPVGIGAAAVGLLGIVYIAAKK